MKKLLLFLLILATVSEIQSQGNWIEVTNMLYPVAGGRAIFNESDANPKFYILGGYSDSLQRAVNWIQEYDVLTNKWRIVGNMSEPRHMFIAGKWGGRILYFGGTSPVSSNKDRLEFWDITQGGDPLFIANNTNFERTYSTGHLINNNFYIIGGSSLQAEEKISYIVEYDLIENKESFTFDLESDEKPLEHMSVFTNNAIYLFGGVYTTVKSWIKKFSIANRIYENLTESLLTPRAGGAAIYNSRLRKGFVIGGYNEATKALRTVEQVIFNANGSLLISNTAQLLYARKNPMVVNYGNTIVVFGGTDESGRVVRKVEIYIDPTDPTSAIEDEQLPSNYVLYQNYPNPFNPTTNIKFALPYESNVTLKIYNLLGQEVMTLVNKVMNAGYHTVGFDASDLTSGLYIYRIEADNFVQVKKMLLMK